MKRYIDKNKLAKFTGTEQYHRHHVCPVVSEDENATLNKIAPSFLYTDGAKYLLEEGGAHWLFDIISIQIMPKLAEWGDMLKISFLVANNTAIIKVFDGNLQEKLVLHISYTDFPEGDWEFFLICSGNGDTTVLLLPSEY